MWNPAYDLMTVVMVKTQIDCNAILNFRSFFFFLSFCLVNFEIASDVFQLAQMLLCCHPLGFIYFVASVLNFSIGHTEARPWEFTGPVYTELICLRLGSDCYSFYQPIEHFMTCDHSYTCSLLMMQYYKNPPNIHAICFKNQ